MSQDWNRYRYLLLGTRRHNGKMVDTPVWFAIDHDRLYAFSNADAGKVKRLRNYAEVRIAPCTVRGRSLGPPVSARARLLSEPAAIDAAHRALSMRYGWQMRWLDWGARLSGRARRRAWIAIDLESSDPAIDGARSAPSQPAQTAAPTTARISARGHWTSSDGSGALPA